MPKAGSSRPLKAASTHKSWEAAHGVRNQEVKALITKALEEFKKLFPDQTPMNSEPSHEVTQTPQEFADMTQAEYLKAKNRIAGSDTRKRRVQGMAKLASWLLHACGEINRLRMRDENQALEIKRLRAEVYELKRQLKNLSWRGLQNSSSSPPYGQSYRDLEYNGYNIAQRDQTSPFASTSLWRPRHERRVVDSPQLELPRLPPSHAQYSYSSRSPTINPISAATFSPRLQSNISREADRGSFIQASTSSTHQSLPPLSTVLAPSPPAIHERSSPSPRSTYENGGTYYEVDHHHAGSSLAGREREPQAHGSVTHQAKSRQPTQYSNLEHARTGRLRRVTPEEQEELIQDLRDRNEYSNAIHLRVIQAWLLGSISLHAFFCGRYNATSTWNPIRPLLSSPSYPSQPLIPLAQFWALLNILQHSHDILVLDSTLQRYIPPMCFAIPYSSSEPPLRVDFRKQRMWPLALVPLLISIFLRSAGEEGLDLAQIVWWSVAPFVAGLVYLVSGWMDEGRREVEGLGALRYEAKGA
ncbi:hypothetical protein DL93DRAFT_2160372 [Clavulina sp. PMI_390]|nr:hypothetical protein DL93DRAFT_2160372 [Clavulina sp. PMI_390]